MPPHRCLEEFPDDPGIRDNDQLLRRIPPKHVVPDQNSGLLRLSSAAFEDDKDGAPMSVYCRTAIESASSNVDRVMAGHEGYGLVELGAGVFRECDQTVHPDPIPEESAHTVICGEKTHGRRKRFAREAQWVIKL
jgi:hypothetical protein